MILFIIYKGQKTNNHFEKILVVSKNEKIFQILKKYFKN
jgi:hypothetical protein